MEISKWEGGASKGKEEAVSPESQQCGAGPSLNSGGTQTSI